MPMMEKAIMEVCIEYIRICNLEIELLPNNVFELLLLILEQDKSNTYQQSFLFSIQLICADYLEIIDAGRPIIGSVTSELDDQFMEIVLDRKKQNIRYRIYKFKPFRTNKNDSEVMHIFKFKTARTTSIS